MTSGVTPNWSDAGVATAKPWPAPRATGPIHARAEVPGSKSESNRALVLALLADGPSTITGVLDSRDTRLMLAGIAALGATVSELGADGVVQVTPPAWPQAAAEPIDCGLAGTVMRFLPPAASLADGPTLFVGDDYAGQRPLAPLLDGLRQLGAIVTGAAIPCAVHGPVAGGEAVIDASASSQLVSGLLLSAARFPRGLTLRHRGPSVPSRPHIDMTVEFLGARGVRVEQPDPDTWAVAPGPIAATDTRVEPDLTTAAMLLAAAAVTGGSVTVPGWPLRTTQGGDQIRDLLQRFGARVTLTPDGDLTCEGTGELQGIDADLSASSELTPVVAALGALASGTTTIRGVAHIRGHETDRLAALTTELTGLGGRVEETSDGLVITGGRRLHGGRWRTYADHRIAHAGAVIGLVVDGVLLDDVSCTTKTLADFPGLWSTLIGVSR